MSICILDRSVLKHCASVPVLIWGESLFTLVTISTLMESTVYLSAVYRYGCFSVT